MTNLEKWKIEKKKEIDEVSNFKTFCGTVPCNACPIESRCLKEKDMQKEFDEWANAENKE